ncbi:acyl-[acyl-carrier-protein] thioesterase [Isobaculum melis]|nr:acyl-ACP thioesterase domain-containing protein [Isobaculum melis]
MSGVMFQENCVINYYECDTTGHLSAPMLLNILLNVSGSQCTELGVGEDFTHQLGVAWVVIQYEIHFDRIPQVNEEITIQTTPLSYNKYFSYRNFEGFDLAGNRLFTVASSFVLMDLHARKMVPIKEEIVAPFGILKENKMVRMTKPEKLTELVTEKKFQVRYLDIDANQHVNNSKYLDWALDVLDFDFLNSHDMIYCNVKYDKEVEYGQIVESKVSSVVNEEGTIKTIHQIKNGEHTACELTIEWKQK